MRKYSACLLSLAILLSACGQKDAAPPTGQVVATIYGTEITAAELRQEMMTLPSGMDPQQAQQAALQAVIARHILAAEAKKQEIDKLPATAIMQERAKELALVEVYSRKLRESAPPPSAEEVQHYVSEHPSSFSQRRIFIVDQMIATSADPELLKEIEPLDTMEQIEALLKEKNVEYRRTAGTMDALQMDPDAAEKIAALPPNAVFASPEGGNIRINRIRETIVEPVKDETAKNIAKQILSTKRSTEIVTKRVNELLEAGIKDVRYNTEYDPNKKQQKAASAAPAAEGK
ncbi:MAG: hypothetical protein R3E11_08610 [Sphingobium sp.]|nr:hypothetical protein [Sphingobium sp.]MCP5397799.1 hypothetical protein [Sphingomonas sp.]